MKTAMQELIEWVKVNDLSLKVSLYNNELINKLNKALEKEKEQIKLSWLDGKYFGNQSNEEDYYNQTYNQNK
jgi:hypothetical protein